MSFAVAESVAAYGGARRERPKHHRARDADAIARALAGARDWTAAPLARTASAFVERRGWIEFGYSRLSDHARERFGRSSRWVHEMALLGRALSALPRLERAMTGQDEGRPLGRVAAALVGRVATVQTLDAWIGRARRLTVSRLRQQVFEALANGDAAGRDGPHPATSDDEAGVFVTVPVPSPVKAAFDEGLELFRAVEGGEATVTAYVEALVAEAMSGEATPVEGVGRHPLNRVEALDAIQEAMARETHGWASLLAGDRSAWGLALAGASLRSLARLADASGERDPVALDRALRELLVLEDRLERRLGQLLSAMAACRAWSELRFAGAGHYSEQRLGLCPTAARDRLRAQRALRRLPRLRRAYESGQVGLYAVLEVVRLLRGRRVTPEIEAAWVVRAREATVKRLRDEVRALERARWGDAARPGDGAQASGDGPLDDATWHASLRRTPGMARDRIERFARLAEAAPVSDVFLRLRLPAALADDFLTAIGQARRRAGDGDGPGWAGLLVLVREFASLWDDPAGMPRRRGDEVYERSGFRCETPGCTSRRNLEAHHVEYRSRGGGDETVNLLCLCRFHHQRGEHGGLARCRGRAPLGVRWVMGRGGAGGRYGNELSVRGRR